MNTHKLTVSSGFDRAFQPRVIWSGEFRSQAQAALFADDRFSRFSHTFKIEEI